MYRGREWRGVEGRGWVRMHACTCIYLASCILRTPPTLQFCTSTQSHLHPARHRVQLGRWRGGRCCVHAQALIMRECAGFLQGSLSSLSLLQLESTFLVDVVAAYNTLQHTDCFTFARHRLVALYTHVAGPAHPTNFDMCKCAPL